MTTPFEAFQDAVKSENLLSMSRAARLLLTSNPDLGGQWAVVVDHLLKAGDEITALQCAQKLVASAPDHAQSYVWLATTQSVMGDHAAARQTLMSQIGRFPNDSVLRTRLGREALTLGQRELARAAFGESLKLNPNDAIAWEGMAETQRFEIGDPLLEQMEQLRLSWPAEIGTQARGTLAYALAKAYSDIGEYDAAARRVSEAAAFLREHTSFDVSMHEVSTRQLIATYDDRFISANEESGVIDSRPVFIVAPPCAGSEWVCDVLSAPDDVARLERSNALFWMSASPLGNHDSDTLLRELSLGETDSVFNAVAHTYLEYLSERFGSNSYRRIIDPSGLNEIAGGAIGLCLPAAKMIYIRRDPRDLAWAIYSRRFRRGRQWTYHPDDIARVLSCTERLMGRWSDLYPKQILQVRYEDLLADPKGQAEQMARFAGVDQNAVGTEAWLRADEIRSDPAEIWTRAGTHFGPMQSALERAGLIEA